MLSLTEERGIPMRKHIKHAWIAAAAIVALAGGLIVAVGSTDGIQPVTPEEAKELLAAVRLGCDTAAASVSSSAGVVTLHEWNWRANGDLLETETTYTVALKGERYRAAVETKYLTNEWSSANSPGTIQKTILGYDGEKVTRYEPLRGYAAIANLDSGIGRELRNAKILAISPGIGAPTFPEIPPTPDNPDPGSRVLGRQTVNGEDCVVVDTVSTAATAKGTQTMIFRSWIALQKGFSLVKAEGKVRGGMFGEGETLIAQIEAQPRECADDLWGISQVQQEEHMVDDSGRIYLSRRATTDFSKDYAINAPVTEDMLTVTLPSGTKVDNELIDSQYTIP